MFKHFWMTHSLTLLMGCESVIIIPINQIVTKIQHFRGNVESTITI